MSIHSRQTKSLLFLCFISLVHAGCGGGAGDGGGDGGTDSQPVKIKRVAAKDLPKLGDYLPPLEQGRLEVAPPCRLECAFPFQ